MQSLVWVSLLGADQMAGPQQTLAAAWDRATAPLRASQLAQRQGSLSRVPHLQQPAVLVKSESTVMQQEASTGGPPCGQPALCDTGAVAAGMPPAAGAHDIAALQSAGPRATPAGAQQERGCHAWLRQTLPTRGPSPCKRGTPQAASQPVGGHAPQGLGPRQR